MFPPTVCTNPLSFSRVGLGLRYCQAFPAARWTEDSRWAREVLISGYCSTGSRFGGYIVYRANIGWVRAACR